MARPILDGLTGVGHHDARGAETAHVGRPLTEDTRRAAPARLLDVVVAVAAIGFHGQEELSGLDQPGVEAKRPEFGRAGRTVKSAAGRREEVIQVDHPVGSLPCQSRVHFPVQSRINPMSFS
jgi:hypothetical protein